MHPGQSAVVVHGAPWVHHACVLGAPWVRQKWLQGLACCTWRRLPRVQGTCETFQSTCYTSVGLCMYVPQVLGYALVRPAREVLFTVVTRQEKYKAKLFIDTVVQRLGDTAAAAAFEVLDVRLALGPHALALAALLACVGWAGVALQLGSRHAATAAGAAAHTAV